LQTPERPVRNTRCRLPMEASKRRNDILWDIDEALTASQGVTWGAQCRRCLGAATYAKHARSMAMVTARTVIKSICLLLYAGLPDDGGSSLWELMILLDVLTIGSHRPTALRTPTHVATTTTMFKITLMLSAIGI
jgi:hypothetical protein